jgi:hypothetical protein
MGTWGVDHMIDRMVNTGPVSDREIGTQARGATD